MVGGVREGKWPLVFELAEIVSCAMAFRAEGVGFLRQRIRCVIKPHILIFTIRTRLQTLKIISLQCDP